MGRLVLPQQTTADSLRADNALVEKMTKSAALNAWLAGVDAALAARPDDITLRTRRAQLLRGLGRLDDAIAAYGALGDRAMVALLRGDCCDPAPVDGTGRFVRLGEVLDARQRQELWRAVSDEAAQYKQSGMGSATDRRVDLTMRRSVRLCDTSPIRGWFLPLIGEIIARERILERLGMAPFRIGRQELQVTRHVDGGFLHVHRDCATDEGDELASRTLTYVYYFHRTPRRFQGGDLLMFDHGADGNRQSDLGATRIVADDNTLVFFAADRLHAVTSVSLASDDPLDGRWTINGWLHPKE